MTFNASNSPYGRGGRDPMAADRVRIRRVTCRCKAVVDDIVVRKPRSGATSRKQHGHGSLLGRVGHPCRYPAPWSDAAGRARMSRRLVAPLRAGARSGSGTERRLRGRQRRYRAVALSDTRPRRDADNATGLTGSGAYSDWFDPPPLSVAHRAGRCKHQTGGCRRRSDRW